MSLRQRTGAQAPSTSGYVRKVANLNDDEDLKARNARRKMEESNPETVDWKSRITKRTPNEFGGPLGCLGIMIFSHFIVWYFFICLHINSGSLILPASPFPQDILSWGSTVVGLLKEHASPTWFAVKIYWFFQITQAVMYVTLPGVSASGLPLPSLNGKKLKYHCNALSTWYVTFLSMAILHFTGWFPFGTIIDQLGPITTVAVISADLIAIYVYVYSYVAGVADEDNSGNLFYDFFMGSWLNPRIGKLDLKMFAEVRVSWIMLFLITSSAAYKFYDLHGYISGNMALICIAQYLYCYAIMKGEECIPPSWDIFHEKWGWMLVFWNLAGVPLVYCSQAVYILKQDPAKLALPTWAYYVMFTLLFAAYYCWDTVNSQKNRFRLQYNNNFQPRPYAFPQLPWGTLENPQYLKTKAGTPLLLSGWYGMARKFHYTTDTVMAAIWTFSCGFFHHFIPHFYLIFFVGMLYHRCIRDEYKCAEKYKEDWEEYCRLVPYRFIPGVY